MTDGENQPDKPVTQADSGSAPSLSGLAERVEGRRNRSDRGDDLSTGLNADTVPAATSAREDPEFFFPADTSPAGDTQSHATSPNLPNPTDTTDGSRTTDSDDSFGPDPKTAAIIELIGDAQNLLVTGPLHTPADYDLCTDLLTSQDDPPEQLLLVTFEESPDERLNVLEGHLGTLPDSIGILNVGDATRSASQDIVSATGTDGIRVRNVRDATDIQRIGLSINKYLSEWADEEETVLCFHSLTALLRAVDSESVFRFLNVLLGRVRSGTIRAHYHIDPDAHDEQTLETYRPLFDETLRYGEDGSVKIDR
jgi:hypothetical protein